MKFFFFFCFFSKVQKVKYLPHLWSNPRDFFSEPSNGNSLQVLKKRNFDPTTWRTSRTTSRWRLTQKVRATQNFIKDKMTGRVDILWCIFEKIAKKLKMKSQEQKRFFRLIYLKTFHKSTFLGPVTSILIFFAVFSNAPDYIDPSGHFDFYENFCSSNF